MLHGGRHGGWIQFVLVVLCGQICAARFHSQDKELAEMKPPTDLRMVLVGKTGAGKSATGNTILGRKAFKAEASASSITSQSQQAEGKVQFYNGVDSVNIKVIDTPGLFDTSHSVAQVKAEIDRCIDMSLPGPHVFLLVISLLNRWTQETIDTLSWIQTNFGEEASDYTIVLFTGVDQLDGKPVKTFLEESDEIQALIRKCKGRYHVFNNREKNNRKQVTELLQKTASMFRENRESHYTHEIFEQAQRKIEEEEERKRLEEERKKKQQEERLKAKLQQEQYEREIKMMKREKREDKEKRNTLKLIQGVGMVAVTAGAAMGLSPVVVTGGLAAGAAYLYDWFK